jgi:hypothetical protein
MIHVPYMRPAFVPPEKKSWEENALAEIQEQLTPKEAHKVVAIRMKGPGFVLGNDFTEARDLFRAKYPNESASFIRADGSPVMTVPWS